MNLETEPSTLGNWSTRAYHRRWLLDQANGLFDFFQYRAVNPKGGFFDMDDAGKPLDAVNPVRGIHSTARMVHCFSIGALLGRPGSEEIVDHGMNYLWHQHRDKRHGGYLWSINNDGPVDASKQGY